MLQHRMELGQNSPALRGGVMFLFDRPTFELSGEPFAPRQTQNKTHLGCNKDLLSLCQLLTVPCARAAYGRSCVGRGCVFHTVLPSLDSFLCFILA